MTILEEPFYLPVDDGKCFAVHRAPRDEARATMLHLPAFGDEMNKARAMTARCSRALAQRGVAVVQVDWQGCGDSTGEHRDGTLARWLANAHSALAWIRDRHPGTPATWLWALRAGALLVAPLTQRRTDVPLLLWQPVVNGKQYLNQLLRVTAAGAWANARGEASSTRSLRARLAAGESLEIGGYEISSRLADELEAASFELPAGHNAPLVWLEVGNSARAPSPAAAAALRSAQGPAVAKTIIGPGFWQSVEIEHCDELIEQSSSLVAENLDAVPGASAVL